MIFIQPCYFPPLSRQSPQRFCRSHTQKIYLLKVEHPRTDTLLILPSSHSSVTSGTFRHAYHNDKKYLGGLEKDAALRDAAPASPLRRIAN